MKSPIGKKLLIALVILAAIAAGAYYILPGMIFDPERIRTIVTTQAKALTGRELRVKGAVDLTLSPSPRISLKNVELEPSEDPEKPVPHLRVEEVVVEMQFASLFAENPVLERVKLLQPVLEVERGSDGMIHWDWLHLPEHGGTILPTGVDIENGKIIYFNPYNEKTIRFEEVWINLRQQAGSGAGAAGQFSYLGHKVKLEALMPSSEQAMKMELKFWQSDKTLVTVHLEREGEKDKLTWRGDLDAKLEDLHQWMPKEEEEQRPVSLIEPNAPPPAPKEPEAPYPFKLAGKVEYNAAHLALTDVELETDDSAGNGELILNFAENFSLTTRLKFDRLKLQPGAFMQYVGSRGEIEEKTAELGPVAAAETAPRLSKNIMLNFDLSADTLFLNDHQFTGVNLTGGMKEGELIIERLDAHFAGDTAINMTGKIVDTAKGMRFQGHTQTSGKDLRAVLATFEEASTRLPEKGFSEFYIDANVFISTEQMRLSEADLKLGELQLTGGMVTYFEEKPRVEAEIVLKDINLDYFRDNWREQVRQGGKDYLFKVNSSVDFSWLKSLKPVIDLKLNFERFTFLDKTGEFASFRLYAQQNEFGVHNIEMQYPDGMFKGTAKVNVSQAMPMLELNLEFPTFDTAYLSVDGKQFGENWVNTGTTDKRWSNELFDFNWMIGVTANTNVTAQRMIHHGEIYDRFVMQSQLFEEQLQIKKLTFERFGGRFDIAGTIVGGKVPGLTASFTLYNADLKEMIKSFSTIDKITGRVSMSGSILATGINLQEWMKQLDSKIIFTGRGLRADGFNMQGVVDAVLASRSVADVVNNVDKALPNGVTEFDLDGNINIAKGVVRTPGMTLKMGDALGNLTGELLIVPWKMAVNMLFQMKMLKSETIPTFTVDLNGSPDKYEMKVDTSSLEAYVAKKIVGR